MSGTNINKLFPFRRLKMTGFTVFDENLINSQTTKMRNK